MATVTIEDPEVHRKEAPVDTRGRVTIGKQYANKRVTVTVEVMDDD